MSLQNATPLPGAVPAWRATVDAAGWRAACEEAARAGSRLGALWAADERDRGGGCAVHAVLVAHEGLHWIELPVALDSYPRIDDLFPAAARMQRAALLERCATSNMAIYRSPVSTAETITTYMVESSPAQSTSPQTTWGSATCVVSWPSHVRW